MNFSGFSSMKPFQIALLVIFGFLLLLGLVLFSRFGGFAGTSNKVGTVTIWGTLPQSSMETVLNALRNSNQDYAGVQYVQKDEASFDNDLAQAISTGQGPDLVLISQEMLATEQTKLSVIPFSLISERTFLDSYLPIDDLFLASNGTYGIPFAVDPLVMYYNRSTLTQAGVAVPPSTWEGMTSLAEQLTSASAGTVAESTLPLGVYSNVENARAIVSLLLLQAGNPITSVSSAGVHGALTSTGADGSSAVTPAQSALTFYTQFADPVKTVYSWNAAIPSARQAFLAGTLDFYPGFASELPQLKAANPNLPFDMMAMPEPQNASQRVTYGKAYAFSVPASSKNPGGAENVAIALSSSDFAPAVSQALSMAPALRSALSPSNNDPYAPIYFPQALIAQGWLSPSPATTDSIFSTMISNITSGRMSVGEALTTANQALDAAF